ERSGPSRKNVALQNHFFRALDFMARLISSSSRRSSSISLPPAGGGFCCGAGGGGGAGSGDEEEKGESPPPSRKRARALVAAKGTLAKGLYGASAWAPCLAWKYISRAVPRKRPKNSASASSPMRMSWSSRGMGRRRAAPRLSRMI